MTKNDELYNDSRCISMHTGKTHSINIERLIDNLRDKLPEGCRIALSSESRTPEQQKELLESLVKNQHLTAVTYESVIKEMARLYNIPISILSAGMDVDYSKHWVSGCARAIGVADKNKGED